MRIIRLDLIAFGPFTNVTLDFNHSRAGLHIVYGPNEAGKSSCLRALRQWLYGIDRSTEDNFVHTYSQLRIGGAIADDQGARLEFIRRKGNDKTLRALDDQSLIDANELTRMLGGVDQGTFAQQFGINYDELVRGGAEIAAGGGELGQILFAAGAGIADVRQIQAGLEREYREIFVPSGAKPPINAGVKQLDDIRKQIRHLQLSTAAWKACHESLQHAEQQQESIDQQLHEQRARKNRLERIRTALPLLSRRSLLLDELEKLSAAPVLAADFAERRREASAQLAAAENARQNTMIDFERLQTMIATVEVPAALLDRHAEITALHADLGGYRSRLKDRPARMAEIRSAKQRIEQLFQDLGRQPDAHHSDIFRLSRVQREQILALVADHRAQSERQTSLTTRLRKLTRERERLEAQFNTLAAERDPAELKRLWQRAHRLGDVDGQLAEARAALQQAEMLASTESKQLPLLGTTLAALKSRPLPLAETIERWEREWADAQAAVAKTSEQAAECAEQIERIAQSLERQRQEHDLPTEDELRQVRSDRDAGWRLVQRVWQDGIAPDDQEVTAFVARWAPGGDLAQAFRASLEKADTVVDRLRREADRVAEQACLTADVHDRRQQLERERASLEIAQRHAEHLQAAWRDLWTPFEISPLPPREMQTWLRRCQAWLESEAHVQTRQQALLELEQRIAAHSQELLSGLERLDEAPAAAPSCFGDLLDRCGLVIASLEETNRARRELFHRIADVHNQVADAELDLADAQQSIQRWQAEWTEAVAAIGLTGEEPPAQAHAVLQTIQEISETSKEIAALERRVEGIDRDNRLFEERVQQVLESMSVQLDMPTEQAVIELHRRLEAAAQQQTKLDEWTQQRQLLGVQLEKLQAAIVHWRSALAGLCHQAGCAQPDELPEAEERSVARQRNEKQRQDIDQHLADLAGGEPLESFLAELTAYQPDEVAAEIVQLSESIAHLDSEKSKVSELVGRHRNELERMDGSAAAAEHQETAEQLLAFLRSNAEQYVRLRLASAVLHRAIERFREKSQGDVLARAGTLFAELTLGSFSGLQADFDESGRAILVGIRSAAGSSTSSGQAASTADMPAPNSTGSTVPPTVRVAGMSDGTRDQLYLALRLALLESYLRDRAPFPVIVDDILIQFDDARSAAALRVLGQFAARHQVIFFTHHHRLVELAQEYLPADQWNIHRLPLYPSATLLAQCN